MEEKKYYFYVVKIDNEFFLTDKNILLDENGNFEIYYCDVNNDGELKYATKPGVKVPNNITIFSLCDKMVTLREANSAIYKLNNNIKVEEESIKQLYMVARK